MLTTFERVIVGKAINEEYVSEHDLTVAQRKLAKSLCSRGVLRQAGKEADGAQVYAASDGGEIMYGAKK